MYPIFRQDFDDVDIFTKFGVSSTLSRPLETIYVCTDLEFLKLSFLYDIKGTLKTFNLVRPKDETVDKALQRIRLNLEKFLSKKSKGKHNFVELDISLEKDGKTCVNDKNCDVWVDGAVLKIDAKEYNVSRDCPQIFDIHVPKVIMSGFPLLVRVQLNNCEMQTCSFFWFRFITSSERRMLPADEREEKVIFYSKSYWYLVATNLNYIPSDADVDHKLILVSIPSDGVKQGPIQYHRTLKEVLPARSDYPFTRRQILTQTLISDPTMFRVLSYNILADVYADSSFSRSHLFKHCDRSYLDVNYRRLLLVKEMEGYNADIMCLQEVDKKEFNFTYKPFFANRDYECVFSEKGSTSEGVACIVNKKKFQMIDYHKTTLTHLIDPDYVLQPEENQEEGVQLSEAIPRIDQLQHQSPELDHFILKDRKSEIAHACFDRFKDIKKSIEDNPSLKMRFCQRKTVVQTSLVKSLHKDNDYLLIVNTHLYFAPDADHIRLLQGAVCVRYMEFIRGYYKQMIFKSTGIQPLIRVLICGDMNSTPDCGLYKLLTEGFVDSDLKDWKSNIDEKVQGLELRSKLKFSSAYQDIEYTNYTPLFHGCLDYIYYDSKCLDCESIVPLPPHDEVTRTGGIPSDVFPSDHVALIANLKFSNNIY